MVSTSAVTPIVYEGATTFAPYPVPDLCESCKLNQHLLSIARQDRDEAYRERDEQAANDLAVICTLRKEMNRRVYDVIRHRNAVIWIFGAFAILILALGGVK